jgi:hypothetical protein
VNWELRCTTRQCSNIIVTVNYWELDHKYIGMSQFDVVYKYYN